MKRDVRLIVCAYGVRMARATLMELVSNHGEALGSAKAPLQSAVHSLDSAAEAIRVEAGETRHG